MMNEILDLEYLPLLPTLKMPFEQYVGEMRKIIDEEIKFDQTNNIKRYKTYSAYFFP